MGDRLVRWGLPRAANAVPYLMGFITAAVATVLVTRSILALAGYTQLGGGGLHVAHVLWGGLLLGRGVMLLLYVAALNSAAAGVSRGLNDRDRHVALRRLEAAGDQPGVAEAAALVNALPTGRGDRVARWYSRAAHRVRAVLESRVSQRIAIGILLVQTFATVALLLLVALFVGLRAAGREATLDLDTATLISTGTAALSAVCVVIGPRHLVRRRRTAAFRWMQYTARADHHDSGTTVPGPTSRSWA